MSPNTPRSAAAPDGSRGITAMRRRLRLLLSGGGTGGHVYPMLAVVQAARNLPSLEVEAFHLGSQAAVEQRILAGAGIPSEGLAVHGLRGSNPAAMGWNAVRMAAAVRPALAAID